MKLTTNQKLYGVMAISVFIIIYLSAAIFQFHDDFAPDEHVVADPLPGIKITALPKEFVTKPGSSSTAYYASVYGISVYHDPQGPTGGDVDYHLGTSDLDDNFEQRSRKVDTGKIIIPEGETSEKYIFNYVKNEYPEEIKINVIVVTHIMKRFVLTNSEALAN